MTSPVRQSWNISPKDAVLLQRRLAGCVSLRPFHGPVRKVAGADVSYDPRTHRYQAAFVVLAWPDLTIIEIGRARGRTSFPYVPGLLSFREIPPLLRAYRRLRNKPDLAFCDGQGLAHPRFFGLACHLGLVLKIPTIGSAKSLLVGEHAEVPLGRGGRSDLIFRERKVGAVLRTREGTRPIFVSPGHRVSINQAVSWTLKCASRHRLPEPTHVADREVARMRRQAALRR